MLHVREESVIYFQVWNAVENRIEVGLDDWRAI